MTRLERIEKAARALANQLHFVHGSGAYRSVWAIAQGRIGPYQGPQYTKELEAVEDALGDPPDAPEATPAPLAAFLDAAVAEAARARVLFPQPNHLTLAMAEESGELVKACLDVRQGKATPADVLKEAKQTIAMCLRLAEEGDPTIGVPPLLPAAAPDAPDAGTPATQYVAQCTWEVYRDGEFDGICGNVRPCPRHDKPSANATPSPAEGRAPEKKP